jgi:hypothetical protein
LALAGLVWAGPAAGTDAARDQAVRAPCVEVGEQDGDRLPHEPSPVGDEAEAAQLEPGVLQVEQLGGGQVDGNLLIVPLPAGYLTFIGASWQGSGGAQQLRDSGNTYPA